MYDVPTFIALYPVTDDLPLLLSPGPIQLAIKALYPDDEEAVGACCCITCCLDQVKYSNPAGIPEPIQGTIFQAKLIGDTTGCFDLNATMRMVDTFNPAIWTSQAAGEVGFFGNAGWRGLSLSCAYDPAIGRDVLTMIWDNTGACPLIDHSLSGTYTYTRISGQCGPPLRFVFSYTIDETTHAGPLPIPGCNCDGSTSTPGTAKGVVTIEITIDPTSP